MNWRTPGGSGGPPDTEPLRTAPAAVTQLLRDSGSHPRPADPFPVRVCLTCRTAGCLASTRQSGGRTGAGGADAGTHRFRHGALRADKEAHAVCGIVRAVRRLEAGGAGGCSRVGLHGTEGEQAAPAGAADRSRKRRVRGLRQPR